MNSLIVKLKHLFSGYVFTINKSGMLPFKIDPNVFETQHLELGTFQQTKPYHLVKTLSVKDQKDFNDCVWNATTAQKEVDENVVLSVRSIVAYGYRNGFISNDGFAQIDSGEKVLKDWGILEQGELNESVDTDFHSYADISLNGFKEEAAKHKIKSYWRVTSRSDELTLLEQGKTFVTGLDWYSGFNRGGGFGDPWIIYRNLGWKIGGHSVLKKGYIFGLDHLEGNKIVCSSQGRDVYVFQNSMSDKWGATVVDEDGFEHKGLFFVDMDFFDKYGYWSYASLDVDEEIINKVKLINMMKNTIRDSKGGFWFTKGKYKQKIESLLGLLTSISVELGVKTDDVALSKLTDITTVKDAQGNFIKPLFPIK